MISALTGWQQEDQPNPEIYSGFETRLGYNESKRKRKKSQEGKEGAVPDIRAPRMVCDPPNPLLEKAGPAENVMVKEVWGTNALVEWQPPKDDGNSEVTGYFVQKADKKTMVRGQRGLGGWGKVALSFLFHSWETEARRQGGCEWEWAGFRRQTAASAPPLLTCGPRAGLSWSLLVPIPGVVQCLRAQSPHQLYSVGSYRGQ